MRRTLASLVPAAVLALTAAHLNAAEPEAGAIESIKHEGVFIRECTLEDETRKDGVVPRHANCIQLSRDRWLVVYSTHGYRGVDDERSIVYQVRRDAPDGAVLKEGFLVRTLNDWKPDGVPAAPDGKSYVKQHGHMVAFGVPKGALIDGKPAAHANVFVAQWRVLGRPLDVKANRLDKTAPGSALAKTQAVEWVQFRLNDRGDDLDVLQPVRVLRQKGFEKGDTFCSEKDAGWMNQSFCPPVPFNTDCTEWAECNHFDKGRVAALKLRFDPKSRLYEWVETGPFFAEAKATFSEASLLHTSKEWIVAARSNRSAVAWARSDDPFKSWDKAVFAREPSVSAPLTAFWCPDGVVRLFTGDKAASPQKYDRDPLYCWDVQPEQDFAAVNRRTLFDSRAAKLPIRAVVRSKVDFCELFPHHGKTQLIVHGVSTRGYDFPYEGVPSIPVINAEEKGAAGLYYAKITYRQEPPPTWTFGR